MADYIYSVRVYVDVSYVPRGRGGAALVGNQSNEPGIGSGQLPGASEEAQTIRFQDREMVPNAIGTAPTAANIGTAISTAATTIQGLITAPILAQIQNWALGQE